MKYQCVFSDIDGTLLNSQHEVTNRTKMKVHELGFSTNAKWDKDSNESVRYSYPDNQL